MQNKNKKTITYVYTMKLIFQPINFYYICCLKTRPGLATKSIFYVNKFKKKSCLQNKRYI